MKTIRFTIFLILIAAAILLAAWAIRPDTSPNWTGFGRYDAAIEGPRSKTLWDWLDLLLIPLAVGLVGWIFKEAEKEKATRMEKERTQNQTLDSFVKTITDLIVNHNLGTADAKHGSHVIARTRTILALSTLDRLRKGQVLQFLFESGLIDKPQNVSLVGADITHAILDGIVLSNAEITGAYLNGASITHSNLKGAAFTGCDFSDANLSDSLLENADLSYTNLTGAKLNNVDLTSANFEGANLTAANLTGSKITQKQINEIIKKNNIKITKLMIT